jgi:hypothetical protein
MPFQENRIIRWERTEEVELVAARMRETLIEVLGEEAGGSLYSMEWLKKRVLWHIDPDSSTGEVFLSEDGTGHITGHTIVRMECDESGKSIGLFSTIFVEPESRNQAVATNLLARGEEWMTDHGLTEAVTYTARHNTKLGNLCFSRGYAITDTGEGYVRLTKQGIGMIRPQETVRDETPPVACN